LKTKLITTNGIRWCEINDGERDLAWYAGGLVSINAEYAHPNMTAHGVPNPKGIRWRDDDTKLTDGELCWLRGTPK
jgi:hypothetical protein